MVEWLSISTSPCVCVYNLPRFVAELIAWYARTCVADGPVHDNISNVSTVSPTCSSSRLLWGFRGLINEVPPITWPCNVTKQDKKSPKNETLSASYSIGQRQRPCSHRFPNIGFFPAELLTFCGVSIPASALLTSVPQRRLHLPEATADEQERPRGSSRKRLREGFPKYILQTTQFYLVTIQLSPSSSTDDSMA
jgi:hypothetical protein